MLIDTAKSFCNTMGSHRLACEITPSDVAEWLRPIHRRAPVSAKQARTWLSAAYTWALMLDKLLA